jgi:hypothetical protein
MPDGIYFQVRLRFPDAAVAERWKHAGLLAQADLLRRTPGFDALDMGDEDLLGGEMTISKVQTLDEAIAHLHGIGFPVDPETIVETRACTMDGEPAIWFAQAGALPRTATVGDLLDHLRSPGIEDGTVEFRAHTGAAVLVHGLLPTYDAYREYRLPLIYAGAAAGTLGAAGTVSFLGESEGEFVATFADCADTLIKIAEPDPQNLVEAELAERFGGIDIDEVAREWTSR